MTDVIINPGPPAPRPPRRLKARARVPALVALVGAVGSGIALMLAPPSWAAAVFAVYAVSVLVLVPLAVFGREKS
jgi:hypothetical protein